MQIKRPLPPPCTICQPAHQLLPGVLPMQRRYTYPKGWVPGMAYAKHFPKPPEGSDE